MSNSWYRLENKADSSIASLWLYEDIGSHGIEAKDFVADLNKIDAKTINVHINSQGGEVYQGFAIYQALKNHPATVNITIDGLAASIASVIAMAGDHVKMAKNAEMMIHEGHVSMSMCNAAEMSKMVSLLDRTSENIASVYAERAGGDIGMWRNAMKAETWFNAKEAVAAGLADEVIKSDSKPRNVSELTMFNFAGRSFAPDPKEVITKMDTPSIDNAADTTPYGPVEYADPGYQADGQKRYPIDTADHVRAAWSYVNQADNAKLYSAEQLANIKERIIRAAKKFGIQISETSQNHANMSVTNETPLNLQVINALKEVFHA